MLALANSNGLVTVTTIAYEWLLCFLYRADDSLFLCETENGKYLSGARLILFLNTLLKLMY